LVKFKTEKMKGLYARFILLIGFFLFAFYNNLSAQNYIDTLFNIEVTPDIEYGKAVNFSGREINLLMDVATPQDDTIPACGRPLIIAVHGGSFIAGTRRDPLPQFWMKSFAKRGYLAASIETRLGMFQENSFIHCQVDGLNGLEWDCLNQTDTLEWYRALYRAQQDVKRAIRYFVRNKDIYHINPAAIYLIGESAGSFTVINAAFMDSPEDKSFESGLLADVSKPAKEYEGQCIKFYNFDVAIDSMNLSRPDLGNIDGISNSQDTGNFRIQGVAGFYGGVLQDIFSHAPAGTLPLLYLFHQPNDLIVPFNYGLIFQGVSNFFANNFGCSGIYNRPHILGSKGIQTLLLELGNSGKNIPALTTVFTNNYADDWAQFLDPSKSGHSTQDPWGTGLEVAQLFATRISDSGCNSSNIYKHTSNVLSIYPNPASSILHLNFPDDANYELQIWNAVGREVLRINKLNQINATLNISNLLPGIYFIRAIDLKNPSRVLVNKIIVN